MILTIFFGVLGFGIMVFVHELGHFFAAKKVGIGVEVFSLGWGGKMIGFSRGETSYQLSWIPIGGYCKMKGDDIFENGEAMHREGSFFAASPLRRIIVAVSGPLANMIFAVIILTIIWWVGFKIYSDENRIILASDYTNEVSVVMLPAAKAGLMTGDRIIGINDNRIEKFQDILEIVATSPDEELILFVQREGSLLDMKVVPELDLQTGAGKIGVYAWRDLVVDQLDPQGSAFLAGLKPGDRITALNGKEVSHTLDLYQELAGKPQAVTVTYQRGAQKAETDLVVYYQDNGSADLGLSFRVKVFSSPDISLPGALLKGIAETYRTMELTVKGITLLFSGVNLKNAVAGPLRITYYVGSVARSGFRLGVGSGLVSFFRFLCLLSVVLFLMNLLPLPALDGGQILIFLIEIIRRKAISPKVIYRIQIVGFSILIVLVVFFTFNDILFFMGR
jgi:regulator of sigma E protease